MLKYRIIFSRNEKIPPILSDINGMPVSNDGYIIGSEKDPHWKMYPKSGYPGIRHSLPITYAITDYIYDENHYAMYTPEQFGPTAEYSTLLRNHFESVHKSKYQAMDDKRIKTEEKQKIEDERIKQENKDKKNQLKKLLLEQQNLFNIYEKEFKKAKGAAERYIRSSVRSGITKEQAQERFLNENPGAGGLENSIIVIKSNITSLKNELKNYS